MMILVRWLILVLLTILYAGCEITQSANIGKQAEVTIDGRVTYQVMDGFGSSQRLFDDPHVIGGHDSSYDRTQGLDMTVAEQDEILDRLYTDLGFTRVRPAIYPLELQPVKGSQFFFEWNRNDC